jgi:hypothetical protein
MMKIKLLLLALLLAPAIFIQAQNRGRFGDTSTYFEKDSIVRQGYELIFYNKDTVFSKETKNALIETFFKVYPPMVERFNKDAAKKVIFVVDPGYNGIAATGGGRIVYNPEWFQKNPNDIDIVTHEVMHIVQNYGRNRIPGWVTEGIADYARYKYGLYNKEANWSLTELKEDHKFNSSYRITARFFTWLENHKNKEIIDRLDSAAREGAYQDSFWKDLTGKTVEELWAEYIQSPTL